MENVSNIHDETVHSAESNLNSSINSFEKTMERFAHKLNDSTQTFNRIRDAIRRPFDLANSLKGTLKREYESFTPYIRTAQDYSRRAISSVRANPRPYIIAVVGLIGIAVLAGLFSKKAEEVETLAAA
jgi:hypothetical protein